MGKSAKYWETETAKVLKTEKNEIRVFQENGKIQVYPLVPSAPNGVGKGSTIDIQSMSPAELYELEALLMNTIRMHSERDR